MIVSHREAPTTHSMATWVTRSRHTVALIGDHYGKRTLGRHRSGCNRHLLGLDSDHRIDRPLVVSSHRDAHYFHFGVHHHRQSQ